MGTALNVLARNSLLSKAQVDEVLADLQRCTIDVHFETTWVETIGDRDLKQSLKEGAPTDFFTREIDALLLTGDYHVAIHSAKDLPEPLPPGLTLIALTKGVDARDMLVLPSGMHVNTLPTGARIATSSYRREAAVRELRQDLCCVDVRGTILSRLAQLATGDFDGLVMPMAAIIRLNIQGLNITPLPGPSAPLQGRLAVVGREGDMATATLFRKIDAR